MTWQVPRVVRLLFSFSFVQLLGVAILDVGFHRLVVRSRFLVVFIQYPFRLLKSTFRKGLVVWKLCVFILSQQTCLVTTQVTSVLSVLLQVFECLLIF